MKIRERYIVLTIVIALVITTTYFVCRAENRIADDQGGSNYMFYSLSDCSRSGWVTPAYLSHQDLINRQLAAMYQNGQRRLRISVQLAPDSTDGVAFDAPMERAYERNVSAFLEQIKRTGFAEIIVVVGGNQIQPFLWRTWDEHAYQFKLRRITAIRNLVVQSGLKYLIDLENEGIPAGNQPMSLQYARRLWSDYVNLYGSSDTVGFSIITTPEQDRFALIREVFGDTLPSAFDLHIYENARTTFVNAHNRLAELELGNISWIIGESYYNDDKEASELVEAIRQTRQPVKYLLQWPLTSNKLCKDVDVAFPEDFNAYEKRGF